MPTLVAQPTRISAAGTKPKLIDEYIGRVNTKTAGVSVAHMRSPQVGRSLDRLLNSTSSPWFSRAWLESDTKAGRWT